MGLVDDQQVVRPGGDDPLLVLGAASEVARGDQQRLPAAYGFSPAGTLGHVVGMRPVQLPSVEARHPEAELLEQLVLPLPADVRGREDERASNSPASSSRRSAMPAEIVLPSPTSSATSQERGYSSASRADDLPLVRLQA